MEIKTSHTISGSLKDNLLGQDQGGIDICYVARVALEYATAEIVDMNLEINTKT